MRRAQTIRRRIAGLQPNDRAVTCSITRGEILYGLYRLPAGKRRQDLEAEAANVFKYVECISVTEAAADQYALIKSEAQAQGTPLDENDLWIAATALSLSAILVSSDTDFKRIAALKVEAWD